MRGFLTCRLRGGLWFEEIVQMRGLVYIRESNLPLAADIVEGFVRVP